MTAGILAVEALRGERGKARPQTADAADDRLVITFGQATSAREAAESARR